MTDERPVTSVPPRNWVFFGSMFDQIMREFAVPSYVRELGSRNRLELFASNGAEIKVEFAVIGEIQIDEEVIDVSGAEEVRKFESREVELERVGEEQFYGKAIVDGDKERPWAIDRVSDAGVLTTIHLRRKRPMRQRVTGKNK